MKCAKDYKCETCQNFTNKKTAKPSSLPQAKCFNELLEMDVFHIKWNEEKRRVLSIIDIYSRYEMNAVVAAETEKEELAILDQWIHAFGCPSRIRTDASGAHMSKQFLQYMDDRGIKGSPSSNGDGGASTCSPTSSNPVGDCHPCGMLIAESTALSTWHSSSSDRVRQDRYGQRIDG